MNPLGAEKRAERHGNDRVDVGVRPDRGRRDHPHQPDVRGERDDRAAHDQISQRGP